MTVILIRKIYAQVNGWDDGDNLCRLINITGIHTGKSIMENEIWVRRSWIGSRERQMAKTRTNYDARKSENLIDHEKKGRERMGSVGKESCAANVHMVACFF